MSLQLYRKINTVFTQGVLLKQNNKNKKDDGQLSNLLWDDEEWAYNVDDGVVR